MLITTIDEIKKYLRVTSVTSFNDSFKPFIEETEQIYILKYLGQDMYDELVLYYESGANDVTELDKLLEHTQRALSKFVLAAAARFMDLEISEGGFTVNATQTAAPASVTRVENMIKKTISQGWDAIEIMLKYMEKNVDSFPLWAASEAYTLQKSTLIQSASEFDKHYTINESRLWFYNNKSLMKSVDDAEIKSKIGTDLYATLLEEINTDSLSVANAAILPDIQRAIAYYTFARSLVLNKYTNERLEFKPDIDMQAVLSHDKEKIESMGAFYLNQAINTMVANIADYPDYEASELYSATSTSYENTAASKIFRMG